MHITNTTHLNITTGAQFVTTPPYNLTSYYNPRTDVEYTTSSILSTSSAPVLTEKQKNLLWVLPTTLGIFFFLATVACILFYTIKKCEILTMRICYKYFGCCNPSARSTHYSELKDHRDDESDTLYLRDLRDRRSFDPDKYLDEK